MNTQTRLGRFLISRFLITIAVVAVFESLVFLFINRVAFPVVISRREKTVLIRRCVRLMKNSGSGLLL